MLVGGSAEGAARKPRCPVCRRLPPRPRPAPVLFAPGFAEGFPEAVAVTLDWQRGKGAECPRATVGEETWRKGKARSWSRCVYIAARVTSAEKRTELTRLIPRGGQGGGPAPEEARPGRVCRAGGCGRRRGRAASSGRDQGGSGRVGWRGGLETSFLLSQAFSPPLTFPSLRY